MKTVRLPIYEDGLETQSYMEIDVRHFLGSSGSEIAHNYIRIVEAPNVEEEMEVINRIISGLPPVPPGTIEYMDAIEESLDEGQNDWIGPALSRTDRTNPWRERNVKLGLDGYNSDDRVLESIRIKRVEYENQSSTLEKPGQADDPTGWRTIPGGFNNYVMNEHGVIIQKDTQKTVVPFVKNGASRALLHDSWEMRNKLMSVEWLFKKTYPEL